MTADRLSHSWRRLRRAFWAVAVLVLSVTSATYAQEAISSTPLTQGNDVVTMPGVGRIILAFLLVAGLAVAIAAALRRVLPKFNARPTPSGNLQVLNKVSLGTGLRVYTLQLGNETVLLAEGRNGLALTVLKRSQEQA
jgi:flagellar biogenesis protein FliO